jgi:adenine specific DNA methylase Mod
MSAIQLRDLIYHGIADLPDTSLKNIAEYVLFIRTQTFQPELLQQEAWSQRLQETLSEMHTTEWMHVEEEFVDYQKNYPVE